MTDERRWTIYVCPGCNEPAIDCPCEPDKLGDLPKVREVVVVPVSSVVPITRLREWVAQERAACAFAFGDGYEEPDPLTDLSALLDDVECASNPNNERTT